MGEYVKTEEDSISEDEQRKIKNLEILGPALLNNGVFLLDNILDNGSLRMGKNNEAIYIPIIDTLTAVVGMLREADSTIDSPLSHYHYGVALIEYARMLADDDYEESLINYQKALKQFERTINEKPEAESEDFFFLGMAQKECADCAKNLEDLCKEDIVEVNKDIIMNGEDELDRDELREIYQFMERIPDIKRLYQSAIASFNTSATTTKNVQQESSCYYLRAECQRNLADRLDLANKKDRDYRMDLYKDALKDLQECKKLSEDPEIKDMAERTEVYIRSKMCL